MSSKSSLRPNVASFFAVPQTVGLSKVQPKEKTHSLLAPAESGPTSEARQFVSTHRVLALFYSCRELLNQQIRDEGNNLCRNLIRIQGLLLLTAGPRRKYPYGKF